MRCRAVAHGPRRQHQVVWPAGPSEVLLEGRAGGVSAQLRQYRIVGREEAVWPERDARREGHLAVRLAVVVEEPVVGVLRRLRPRRRIMPQRREVHAAAGLRGAGVALRSWSRRHAWPGRGAVAIAGAAAAAVGASCRTLLALWVSFIGAVNDQVSDM